eukprot:TRINITY_DN4582_c0_g2_i1.p1 TRINITY_DN4582_c0_g2~~TRINITY_DN4582_c0_g2_i1.p1  ORF type:complete len:195 (+),score=29.18 TRINITY_DN4582_c0_g2_i1:628-1212(+)
MGCNDQIFGWAVGVGSLTLPEPAGFRMGPSPGAAKYVVVQMHYTNPNGYTDKLDSSGFGIHYTDELRQYDASVLGLGDPFLRLPPIPPGMAEHHYEITCPEECTSQWPHEIHVFADTLHMHFTGKKIWSSLYNGEDLLEEMNGAEYYSYDFQQATEVDYVIKPGDRIHTHCVFDTTRRTEPTNFDLASTGSFAI